MVRIVSIVFTPFLKPRVKYLYFKSGHLSLLLFVLPDKTFTIADPLLARVTDRGFWQF